MLKQKTLMHIYVGVCVCVCVRIHAAALSAL